MRVVRVNDFVGVVAASEWDAVSAARLLKTQWSESAPLLGAGAVREWMRAGPFEADETLVKKGDARQALASAKKVNAEFYWPMQSHGSMGPSCAVADVRDGKATVWSASQATHRFRETIAKALALPKDAVRVVYLDGSGCYGMNGHDDAAADAALLSKAVARPVRVQWSREDEHGWDPKAPPQLLSLEGAVGDDGKIAAWRTDMWIPKATANLPNMPLLALDAAGIAQTPGLTTGPDQPERRSALRRRASGSRRPLAEVVAAAAVEFPRAGQGRELLRRRKLHRHARRRRAARPGGVPPAGTVRPARDRGDPARRSADRMAAASIAGAERARRRPRVRLHALQAQRELRGDGDRGRRRQGVGRDPRATRRVRARLRAVINPAALKAQIEGNILQTLSRTLFEEVAFDRSRVTSVDWASYPILRFPDAPEIVIELVSRPLEPPLGAGEASATPVPAALANAVYDAVGARVTTVPFTRERVQAALGQIT